VSEHIPTTDETIDQLVALMCVGVDERTRNSCIASLHGLVDLAKAEQRLETAMEQREFGAQRTNSLH
jgi:hypothetical protein